MDILKKLFPHAFKSTDTTPFVIALVIYVVIGVVGGVVIGLLTGIPLLGWLFVLLGSIVDLYSLGGIVFSILTFTKVLK